MNLLVIGAGLLGSKFPEIVGKDHDLTITYCSNPVSFPNAEVSQLDIMNRSQTFDFITGTRPETIILTAAATNVDRCETDHAYADINVTGTQNVVDAASKTGSTLVYISTDYVFDGKKGMYQESDPVNPIDNYGLTKLEGEKIVQTLDDFIIARTSVIYGLNRGLNYATWVIDELEKGNEINVVTDQYTSPTLADDLAGMVISLIEKEGHGIFHASGRERIDRFDFAVRIARIFGLDRALINPITSDKLNWVAKRPMDSSLDVSKISGIKKPLNINEGLEKMKEMSARY